MCVCMCVRLRGACPSEMLLPECRLAEVSHQTRSGWARSREHYTDTHTVGFYLPTACLCLSGVARFVIQVQRLCFQMDEYYMQFEKVSQYSNIKCLAETTDQTLKRSPYDSRPLLLLQHTNPRPLQYQNSL